jgi:penicillin-binding protein 1A
VDPIGIARAAVRNLLLGGFREGASTITQQLARNSFPLGGKTLHRKAIEAALSEWCDSLTDLIRKTL